MLWTDVMATSHIAPPGFQAGPPCFLTYVQNGCYSPFSHVLHLVLQKHEEFKTGHLGTWQDDGQGKCQHKRSGFWIGRLSALWVRTHWCTKIGGFWASLTTVPLFPSLWTFKLHKQVTDYQITKSAPEVWPGESWVFMVDWRAVLFVASVGSAGGVWKGFPDALVPGIRRKPNW